MKKIPFIISLLLLVWTSGALAAAPGIERALFDEAGNILEIHFDAPVLTDAVNFNIGGLSFSDGSGDVVELNGGEILNASPQDTVIRIKLTFMGNIGFYQLEIEGKIYDYYTWGTDYRRLEDLESLNHDNLTMSARRLTYMGINYDTNTDITGIDLDYIADTDPPQLTYAEYIAGMNRLRFVFDRPVQWDAIDEDRMHWWLDSLGFQHRDPGNGILDADEDRNDNGVLDLEPNVDYLSIAVSDTFGSITLSAGEIIQTADSDTIEIALVRTNYRPIESLATDMLKLSFPNYTFVDTDFNPVAPQTEFDLGFVPDTIPLVVDSATYDKSRNELRVYFEGRSLGRPFSVVPKFKIVKDDTIPLQGSSGPPVISADNIKIPLIPVDQMAVEAMLNNTSTDTVKVIVESYAILDEYGNGNEHDWTYVNVLEETGSHRPPVVDSIYYDAGVNILTVQFDVRLLLQTGLVDIQGFSLVNGEDTIAFTTQDFGGFGSRLDIELNPTDECNVEGVQDTDNFLLLLEPFSVYQQPRMNGNWGLTADSLVRVGYTPDSTTPLPDYVKYNSTDQTLILHFTDAMSDSVDFSKIFFADTSTSITGAGVSYGDTAEYGMDAPAWLILGLTDADVAGIEDTSTVRDAVIVSLDEGAFRNKEDLESPDLMNFMDGDYLFDAVGLESDTVKVLAGIGRDFYLISREAFPTLDRTIPATIRKVGEHCLIWVADDQWTPYDSVDMFGSIYYTNNGAVPLLPEEVDVVYNHFESIYDSVIGYFAAGMESNIPEVVDIFLCDVRDEYSLGRNDTKDTYWIGSFFNANDQYTEFQAGDEFNTNEMDLIYIDTWPQLYTDEDSSWYWYETSSTREWRLNLPPGRDNPTYDVTNIPITINNAIDNAYAKLVCYKVDRWESQWMVEGFASLAELLLEGEASFYGAGSPTTPTANSLKNFSTGLKSRIDFFNAYLFVLYLYEKFGGMEFIEKLAVQPSVDMSSINITFQRLLQDPSAGTPVVRQRWSDYTAKDIFSYYAMACLLDTTNMDYTAIDPTIAPDDTMFNFANVNVQGVISSKNATAMKWDLAKGPPPYNINQEEWSFEYFYSTFNPLSGLTNPLIAAVDNTGGVSPMVDTTRINVLLPFSEINVSRVLLKNEGVSTPNDPHFYWEYFPYDTVEKMVSFDLSPDTAWTMTHYKAQGGSLAVAGDYKTMVLALTFGGTGKITYGIDSLDIFMLSVAQSPLVASRFDIYLIVSDMIWGAGRQGSDVPEIRFNLAGDSLVNSLPMEAVYNLAAPEDTIGLSFFIAYADFDTPGEYEIRAYFTDISGREYLIGGMESFSVDQFHPGSTLFMSCAGASFRFEESAFSAPLKLSLCAVPQNAAPGDNREFLYDRAFFSGPPVVDRIPVGPAYNLQPAVELDEPVWVSLPYAEYSGEHSPGDMGVYLYYEGEWVYLGGIPDPATQTIKVRAKRTGLMQIQSGSHGEVFFPVPETYSLRQNYPNPFNPITRIDYQIPQAAQTTLKIYDVSGREVAALQDGFQNTGYYSVYWDGRSRSGIPVASGIYFYRLKTDKFSKTCKMIFLK